MTPITRHKRQESEESNRATLPTSSLGWNGLQALKSRLIGRLARFTKDKADDERPRKFQNDADSFEVDLRYIFNTTPTVIGLSEENYRGLDQKAQNLLTSLNEVVNENLIKPPEDLSESPETIYHEHPHRLSHDIAMLGEVYPRLSALIRFLDATADKVNLTSGSGSPLFTLPHGEAGSRVMSRVTELKAFLEELSADAYTPSGCQSASQPETHLLTKKSTENQPDVLPKRASVVVDAIFKEFQQLNCGVAHEIRLRLSEDLSASSSQPALDMFISCCPSGDGWQEVRCGPFQ